MDKKKEVILRHGYISIPDYDFGDSVVLQNFLSEFNEISHKREYYGLSYDENTRELRVPMGVGINMVANILNRNPVVDYNADSQRAADINLNIMPRDKLQEQIITDIVLKNRKYSQSCIIAGTGVGKTYCAIACSSFFKNAVMVISHSSKLRTHWRKKILEYTDLEKDDVMVMDSSKKVMKVLEEESWEDYKIFTTTHQILYSLAKQKGWDYISELFDKFGIGFTIIDEVHRQFRNTVRILTHTNTKKYLLLTATFKQSAYAQNRIFQMCFKTVPKFIQDDIINGKSQKHITGYVIEYNSRPSMESQLSCEVRGLFNTVYYDNYLVTKDPLFYTVFDQYVQLCINGVKPFNGKGLVFCGSINACEILAKHTYKLVDGSDTVIGIYHSKVGITKEEKENLLKTADIIFTTSGSLGEGADIEDLHYIIDIEAFRSEILRDQVPGRLRDLNDGHKFNYFKIANIGFRRVASQLTECARTWEKNFGSVQYRQGIKPKV